MVTRRNKPTPVDLRRHLRTRLLRIRQRLVDRDGVIRPEFVRAFGLDRLAQLDAGQEVPVVGFEIREAVPKSQRVHVEDLGHYVLGSDGKLRRL